MSFAPGPLDVREGGTVEIGIRYQIRDLAAPWQRSVSPLPESASADDFELSVTSVEVPAGQGVSGEAFLELTATEDPIFDEGDEAVLIRFVPGGPVNARLGADLRVSIHDSGVSPCPGVSLVATPPAPGGVSDAFVQRFFTIRIDRPRNSLGMEFVGPYWDPGEGIQEDVGLPRANTNFAANIGAWQAEMDGEAIQHELDLQLYEGLPGDPDLRLAFLGAECEAPIASCSFTECELNK